jgi:hypothetical protein
MLAFLTFGFFMEFISGVAVRDFLYKFTGV